MSPSKDPVGFADLHTHSVFSDGTAQFQEFIDSLHFLSGVNSADINERVYGGEREYYRRHSPNKLYTLSRFSEQAAYVANNLRALALTDHNTVLGLEPLLRSLPSDISVALVGGTEITTVMPTAGSGHLGIHLLAYFRLRDASYDLRQLTEAQRHKFFAELLQHYVPILNYTLKGVNERFGTLLPERINAVHPDQELITGADIGALAEEQITPYHDLLKTCVIRPEHHPLALSHAHIATVLHRRGIVDDLALAHRLVGRGGRYYVDYNQPWAKDDTYSVAARLRKVAKSSAVDVRLSLAHPFTYVRWFEHNEDHDWSIAYASVDALITELAVAGLIDAIEAIYPRYHVPFLPPTRKNNPANKGATRKIARGRQYAEVSQHHFSSLAHVLNLRLTGGSDFHGVPDTRIIGIGNGELVVPAHHLDELFA